MESAATNLKCAPGQGVVSSISAEEEIGENKYPLSLIRS